MRAALRVLQCACYSAVRVLRYTPFAIDSVVDCTTCASVQDMAWLSTATAHFDDENNDFRPGSNGDFRPASDTAAVAAGCPLESSVSELSIEGRSVSAPMTGGMPGDDATFHESGHSKRQPHEDDVIPPQKDDVVRREAEDRPTPLRKHGVEEAPRHGDADNNKENGGDQSSGQSGGRGMSNAVPFVRRTRSEKSPTSGTGCVSTASYPNRPRRFFVCTQA